MHDYVLLYILEQERQIVSYSLACMRALQEQMYISLFREAFHLPGIDCLHGAAQVCSPCRSNRDPKIDPLNSGSSTVQWQPKS